MRGCAATLWAIGATAERRNRRCMRGTILLRNGLGSR